MLHKVTLSVLFTLAGFNSFAISTTTPSKTSDGVALERIQAYSDSFLDAQTVGIVESGTALIEHTTFLKTKPGMAIMEERPKDRGVPFDRGAQVYIWEYLEGGFSKVIINNIPYTTKIARSKEECKRFPPSPKYCWARVIKEPEYYEWKQVSLQPDAQRFWILNRIIDGSGIISVRDSAISKTRLIQTKTKNVPVASDVETTENTEEQAETKETVIEERDDSLLWTEDMLDDMQLPEDPIERQFVIDMAKPKSVREKERKEAAEAKKKAEEEAAKAEAEKNKPVSQEEMFKQEKLNQQSSLNANITGGSTANTIKQVNTSFEAPAQKLDLKANQPLTLPLVD